jgi:hypothetical protein
MIRFTLLLTALSLSCTLALNAQYSVSDDTTKRTFTANKPKPYREVVTPGAYSKKGLFTVHKVDERFYFEIPNTLLGRDMLVVNRISRAPAGVGYSGDEINENVIRFEKGPYNKIFLNSISHIFFSGDSTENGMYHSVVNSNMQPIVAAFDIKAFSVDSSAMVIDMTDFINSDNELFFFHPLAKNGYRLGALQPDKSYIDRISAFPLNIEIGTVKTYSRAGVAGMPSTNNATYALNSSIVLLPAVPMQPRIFDARVGYFSTEYVDFDANPQGVEVCAMITRWRLEPKEEDKERYLRGELVEPCNPIIYYIDPTTPKKWVPYLMQGVNDWQVAFEQAGFKHAIIAKEAPAFDSAWSIYDARHNVIVYKPSTIKNASGPHVHDPRSGEILETHINWYHNVMQLLHDWYMVQAGAVDPRARTMKFQDELMGQLIRFVSSHEVGHTLGLRHNFGASSTVPVDSLRSKSWLNKHGHTPSIMDYARFNYVAQPEDSIDESGIFPRIGEYDKWAIEWGYRWWPALSPEKEKEKLNSWIINKLKTNTLLQFGAEFLISDPRCQREDLGDDAFKASLYGIKNLQRILPRLPEWTKDANEGYANLGRMYRALLAQYNIFIGHNLRSIGGLMHTPKSVQEEGPVNEFVPRKRQKEAMKFLNEQVFKTPFWLLDKNIFLSGSFPLTFGETLIGLQANVLTTLIEGPVINNLLQFEQYYPGKAYTPSEMLEDLKNGIMTELVKRETISVYRRSLQKAYIVQLIKAISAPPPGFKFPLSEMGGFAEDSFNDGSSIIKGHLKQLAKEIKATMPFIKDKMSNLHLQDLVERIDNAFRNNGNK